MSSSSSSHSKPKGRVQKAGKRYAQKDRRVPRKKEYGTIARTKAQRGKGRGKFTWGSEYDDALHYEDYEEDFEEDYAEVLEQEAEMAQALDEFASGTEAFYRDLASFKLFIKGVIADFFENGVTRDLMDAVAERDDPRFNYELVKRAITMSLDRRNREREMVSQLLVELLEKQFIRSEDIADGFTGVFEQMKELKLDCPKAPRYVAIFLARAITDECLAPRCLERGAFIEAGGAVVQEARTLLSMTHGASRMEHAWGSSAFSVKELKKAIRDLIREYIISEDIAEAAQCIRDLDSKNFHHEVVKRAIEISMDYSAAKQAKVAQLLHALYSEEIVHPTQFMIGFKRLFEGLPGLRYDVPAADSILNGFVAHGKRVGYLPATYVPPSWLEAHSSEDSDDASPGDRAVFTAEMAAQMDEFEVISPRTEQRIHASAGMPVPGEYFNEYFNVVFALGRLTCCLCGVDEMPHSIEYACSPPLCSRCS